MKYIRLLLFVLCLMPCAVRAASNDFMVAAQLLSAAKNGDIQQVQLLINNGANVNYVDSTGLSVVCTALMNKDVRAAQILQMYGADASKCDRQIKQYNNRNRPKSSGGLFSGLSSAQSLVLAAAGAAVVVGGLFLLTDVFDPGNDNKKSASTGERPSGDGGTTTGTGTVAFTLPYGPAMPNAESEKENYATNLNYYSSLSNIESIKNDFLLMTNVYKQNYLLMMRGYSALARGYLGMRTLRNLYSGEPINLNGNNLGRDPVLGGQPVNVALVTANGVNAADKTALADVLLPWTTLNNGVTPNGGSNQMVSSKYYNNKIVYGTDTASLNDDTTVEDSDLIKTFDLSGSGTAINNPNANALDNLLAKVVGGSLSSSRTIPDYVGFMPNGQMTIFRTGNGVGLRELGSPVESGTYVRAGDTFQTGDILNLFDKTLLLNVSGNNIVATASDIVNVSGTLAVDDEISLDGQTLTVTQVDGNNIVADYTVTNGKGGTESVTYNGYVNGNKLYIYRADTTDVYNAYIGADGYLYIDGDADGVINQAYNVTAGGDLYRVRQQDDIDYQNYKALLAASVLWVAADGGNYGRSRPDVFANAAVIKPLSLASSATVNDVLAAGAETDAYQSAFVGYVNEYYDRDSADGIGGANDAPGTLAVTFFNGLGSTYSPLVIFSTGALQTYTGTVPVGVNPYAGAAADASFETAAPLVFNNLEHLFMSVVAVGQTGNGTGDATNISGYNPANKYTLAVWSDDNGTPDETNDDTYYKSRVCGIAGRGLNGVDPWCFSATGVTDELAVSAVAGAAGVVRSAFYNVKNFDSKQLFTLLALTADGPYLATSTGGGVYTKDTLISYLQSLYELPNEYQVRFLSGENYLDLFKEVYGYGVINVERATQPGTSVYFYNGNKIVSANGNAYWRAANDTVFRSSAALGGRAASISVPFFDILESVDGEMRLPRVWANDISLGENNRRALYMGDVLGDLKTRVEPEKRMNVGNFSFAMSVNPRPYYDRFNGLENLKFNYNGENWNLGAGYQHYLTDGVSRFSGLANPVMAMTVDALVSDAAYKMGRWEFGARAFSGAITDEGLLENDPTVSSQFNPARLGLVHGAQSHIAWHGDKFDFTASVGGVMETGTVLGTQTGGFMDLGNGKTTYLDNVMRYRPANDVTFTVRSTVAHTAADATGDYVLGMSDITSDALAFGADVGNFSLSVSRPLAACRGALKYAYAQYDVVENADGNYDLVVRDTHVESMKLSPEQRELRFMGAYRRKLGEFTDGALGFIYRMHPNNTDDFGNESIFMMKISHRLGI